MNSSSILIVDDQVSYLNLLQNLLNDEGYKDVTIESNPLQVLNFLKRKKIDLIILDIYMPQINGLDLLEQINQKYPQIPVIMLTALEDVKLAIEATNRGAYEFITKPPDLDRLYLTIKRALEKKLLSLERDLLRKHDEIEDKKLKTEFPDIITNSKEMLKVFELVKIFAPTNETILITGETGTGKDLIARKIYEYSQRKDKPYVQVNVASISPNLFESELFGHEKGSFTGASNVKKGYFEAANGGTIFLDEIGDLSKELQGKLLRTIQYNEIYRLGSSSPIKLDTRIIAATNKNLIDSIKRKEFRNDLYYRLTRGYINLPPLRNRKEDIVTLLDHFLSVGNKIYKKNIKGFSENILSNLKEYTFPGNIRELENIVLNAVAKTDDQSLISEIEIPEKGAKLDNNIKADENNFSTIDEAVINYIKKIMKHTNGNVQQAASILGISERTLQRRLQQIRKEN